MVIVLCDLKALNENVWLDASILPVLPGKRVACVIDILRKVLYIVEKALSHAWVSDNLSIPVINSKFNEILNHEPKSRSKHFTKDSHFGVTKSDADRILQKGKT